MGCCDNYLGTSQLNLANPFSHSSPKSLTYVYNYLWVLLEFRFPLTIQQHIGIKEEEKEKGKELSLYLYHDTNIKQSCLSCSCFLMIFIGCNIRGKFFIIFSFLEYIESLLVLYVFWELLILLYAFAFVDWFLNSDGTLYLMAVTVLCNLAVTVNVI